MSPSHHLNPSFSREACRTNYLVTASIDGHVKLWKKQDSGIEFVKHYRAHLATIVGISASSDGQMFASVSEDGTAKVFDILNYGGHRFPHRTSSTPTVCRHDQHDKTRFHPPRVLLGSQAWNRSRDSRSVRYPSCVSSLSSS